MLGGLCLSDGSGESSDQHGREHRKDPTGKYVGDLELLVDEDNLVINGCVKCSTDGVNPECDSKSFYKPWPGVRNAVCDGVGNHSSTCEPKGGAEDTFVEIREAAGEDFWVDHEASDHGRGNAKGEEDVHKEHEGTKSSEAGEAIWNNRKSQSRSTCRHGEGVPRKCEML